MHRRWACCGLHLLLGRRDNRARVPAAHDPGIPRATEICLVCERRQPDQVAGGGENGAPCTAGLQHQVGNDVVGGDALRNARRHGILVTNRHSERKDLLPLDSQFRRLILAIERHRPGRTQRGRVNPQDRDIALGVPGEDGRCHLDGGTELHFYSLRSADGALIGRQQSAGVDDEGGRATRGRPQRNDAVLPFGDEERRICLERSAGRRVRRRAGPRVRRCGRSRRCPGSG